jgi:hypothetical protein
MTYPGLKAVDIAAGASILREPPCLRDAGWTCYTLAANLPYVFKG